MTTETTPTKFSLRAMTCAELANLISISAPTSAVKECAHLRRIREFFGGDMQRISLLHMLGNSPARNWRSSIRSAELVTKMPAIRLVIGGGMPPGKDTLPRYTKRMRAIAADNGITAQRWGRGAFTVMKSTPPRKTPGSLKPQAAS